jgi:hypothetical protein
MVNKELRRIAGVRDVTPAFIRRSVRVQHHSVPDSELVPSWKIRGLDFDFEPVSAIRLGRLSGVRLNSGRWMPRCVRPCPKPTKR